MSPLVGKAADAFDKLRVFYFGTAVMIVMVLTYTHMGMSTVAAVTAINASVSQLASGLASLVVGSQCNQRVS